MDITLSEPEKAWLAGFVDGEGYIGITYQIKKETNSSSASDIYHPLLIIVNTNKEALEYIRRIMCAGTIYDGKLPKKNEKPSYQYKVSKRDDILVILRLILPYLKIKKRQGNLLIKFIERRKNIKPITGRGHRGASSYSEIDRKIYEELLLLNKRGV